MFSKTRQIDHFWAFLMNFCPLKNQNVKCKRSSLRSQCMMRLFSVIYKHCATFIFEKMHSKRNCKGFCSLAFILLSRSYKLHTRVVKFSNFNFFFRLEKVNGPASAKLETAEKSVIWFLKGQLNFLCAKFAILLVQNFICHRFLRWNKPFLQWQNCESRTFFFSNYALAAIQ